MAIKITPDNYTHFLNIFSIIVKHLYLKNTAFSKEANPLNILKKMENENPKIAMKSLALGITDVVSSLKYFPQETLSEANRELTSKNLPGINTLINIVKKLPANVLKRQRIKSEQEYYALKELLDDTANALTEEEKELLSYHISVFENSQSPTTNPEL